MCLYRQLTRLACLLHYPIRPVLSSHSHSSLGAAHHTTPLSTPHPVTNISAASMAYTVEERGTLYTDTYRLFVKCDTHFVSPFHDIPLMAPTSTTDDPIYHMVVEIPRWTTAKMEIATCQPLNPIRQDMKKCKPRHVANVFPHHGYIWNYGALPQTWESPHITDTYTRLAGDNDPVDVCELGGCVRRRGEVVTVRLLGAVALIDEGETDWKILALSVDDPMSASVRSLRELEQHWPGYLQATVEWLRNYKRPDGKPANTIAFDGEVQGAEIAREVVQTAHKQWQGLVRRDTGVDPGKLDTRAVKSAEARLKLSVEEAEQVVAGFETHKPSSCPPNYEVNHWNFIDAN